MLYFLIFFLINLFSVFYKWQWIHLRRLNMNYLYYEILFQVLITLKKNANVNFFWTNIYFIRGKKLPKIGKIRYITYYHLFSDIFCLMDIYFPIMSTFITGNFVATFTATQNNSFQNIYDINPPFILNKNKVTQVKLHEIVNENGEKLLQKWISNGSFVSQQYIIKIKFMVICIKGRLLCSACRHCERRL